MFKLNFEKTVLFVLLLIILISTANIYSQYIKQVLFGEEETIEQTDLPKNVGLPTALFKADKYYEEKKYKEAASEYKNVIASDKLSNIQQKALANFKYGLCNFKLGNTSIARDSFIKCTKFNSSDAIAYNNAAVCSYNLKDYAKALEYEQKAISFKPTVEYYYNMGRIYETMEDYSNSAKYYIGLINGEDSLTYDDFIDPVQVRNKVMRMVPSESVRAELSKEFIIALMLTDMREVLLISDTDMNIKNFDFDWKIVKVGNTDKLSCSYDRDKLDPYHLIKSLTWIIKSGNEVVFNSKNDSVNINLNKNLSYTVTLNIEAEDKTYTKTRLVYKNQIVDSGNKEEVKEVNQADQRCKFYLSAIYEQLFEKDMKINKRNYTDRFGVVWGKDDIEVGIVEKDFIDAQSALYIKNTSTKRAGAWADLTSLIRDKRLRGRTVAIRLYSRKVSADANLYISIRTKVGKSLKYIPAKYQLDYKWTPYNIVVPIHENADGLNISFRTDSGEEIKIDGFTITIIQ